MRISLLEACNAIRKDSNKMFVSTTRETTYRLEGDAHSFRLSDDTSGVVIPSIPFELMDASWGLRKEQPLGKEGVVEERILILQLALQEAHRKKEDAERDLETCEKDYHRRAFEAGVSRAEKERFERDTSEARQDIKGWEETLAAIRTWREELHQQQ